MEDAKLYGSGDGLALVGDVQFAVDVVGVLLDRAWGDVQPGGDFIDAQPLSQQIQDFKLSLGQQRFDLSEVGRRVVGVDGQRKCGND